MNSRKEYYVKNRENNIDEIRERNRIYHSYKMKNDLQFRIKKSMRSALHRCIHNKNYRKSSEILGYTAQQLILRLECQFKNGMSWENYGLWEIDHKKPVSKFKNNTDPKIINALCNLQPLWASENRSKSNSFTYL